jgi:hypothetical protein
MRDGPEGAEIISEVEIIEVGQDASGKTLTSLVVKPTDSKVNPSSKWLNPLILALNEALEKHGEPFMADGNYIEKAVPQGRVREEFYSTYLIPDEDGDDAASRRKREDKLRKAFSRAMEDAQSSNLIRTRPGRDGVPMVWKADNSDRQAPF